MNETVKIWFQALYKKELDEAKASIKNEKIWELGYDGSSITNPHTDNIKILNEYIETLEEKLAELEC